MRARSLPCLATLALLIAALPTATPAEPAAAGCDTRTVTVEKIPVTVSVCMTGFVGIVDDVVSANGATVTHGLTVGAYGAKPGGAEYGGAQNTTAVAPPPGVPSSAPTGGERNSGPASTVDTVDLTDLGIPKESLEITFTVSGFKATVARIVLKPEGTEL